MPHSTNDLPIRIPGVVPACLSPDEYARALPIEWHTPAEVRQVAFWQASAPLQDVHRDGVHFKGRVYFHPAIKRCVSTGRDAVKPTFMVRFDAARLSSGVLEEIDLYVMDHASNGWQHVARCREVALLAIAAEERLGPTTSVLKERNAYEAELAGQRDASEDVLVELLGGKAAREDVAKQRERRKHGGAKPSRARFDPVPIIVEKPARSAGKRSALAALAADDASASERAPTGSPRPTTPLEAHAPERPPEQDPGIMAAGGLASPLPDSQDASWATRALMDLASDISSPESPV